MSLSLPPISAVTGKEWTVLFACYLVGCFTAGYYWVRWRTGQDIRDQGSGNVGARNVGRMLGTTSFVATALVDLGKGALAVGMALYFGLRPEMVIAAMLAVVIGHNWPMQLRFHGGKGVATSVGALLAYNSFLIVLLLALFLPLLAVSRRFTMSGLLAFALSPLLVFLWGLDDMEVVATSLLGIVVLFSHRKNIRQEFARIFPGHPVKETSNRRATKDDDEF